MGYWLLFEPFECRVRLPVVFKCRVLVRSTLVAVIQRVSWVKVWPGESLVNVMPRSSLRSLLLVLLRPWRPLRFTMHTLYIWKYMSTSYFSSCLMAPPAFSNLYPWWTPTPRTKRSVTSCTAQTLHKRYLVSKTQNLQIERRCTHANEIGWNETREDKNEMCVWLSP